MHRQGKRANQLEVASVVDSTVETAYIDVSVRVVTQTGETRRAKSQRERSRGRGSVGSGLPPMESLPEDLVYHNSDTRHGACDIPQARHSVMALNHFFSCSVYCSHRGLRCGLSTSEPDTVLQAYGG